MQGRQFRWLCALRVFADADFTFAIVAGDAEAISDHAPRCSGSASRAEAGFEELGPLDHRFASVCGAYVALPALQEAIRFMAFRGLCVSPHFFAGGDGEGCGSGRAPEEVPVAALDSRVFDFPLEHPSCTDQHPLGKVAAGPCGMRSLGFSTGRSIRLPRVLSRKGYVKGKRGHSGALGGTPGHSGAF